MAINREIIESGKALSQATAEQNFFDASGAVNEGKKVIFDQLDANKKAKEAEEDRKHEIELRNIKLTNEKLDLEEKQINQTAKTAEWFKLISDGKKAGLLTDDIYNEFANDREAWWKETSNKMKAFEDIGDKEAFKTTVANVIQGEGVIADKVYGAIDQIPVSNGDKEASTIQRVLSYNGEAGKKPKIVEEGGLTYFVFADNLDPDNPVKILAEDMASFDGSNWEVILGDFSAPATLPGLENELMDSNPQLLSLLRKKQAREGEIMEASRGVVSRITTEEGVIEVLDGVETMTGFDVKSFVSATGISLGSDNKLTADDFDTDPNTPGVQPDKEALAHLLSLSLTDKFGAQTDSASLRPEERTAQLEEEDIRSSISQRYAKVKEIQVKIDKAENEEEKAILKQEQDTEKVNLWAADPTNVNILDDVGQITTVRWVKTSGGDKWYQGSEEGVWQVTLNDGTVVEAGTDVNAGPDKSTVEGFADPIEEFEELN